jgi:hypothetical protein
MEPSSMMRWNNQNRRGACGFAVSGFATSFDSGSAAASFDSLLGAFAGGTAAVVVAAVALHSTRMAALVSGHDTTRHDTTRHDTTRHDTTRHDTTRHDTTRHDTTRHDTTRHATTRHDTTRHDTTRHDTTRHDTTRHLQSREQVLLRDVVVCYRSLHLDYLAPNSVQLCANELYLALLATVRVVSLSASTVTESTGSALPTDHAAPAVAAAAVDVVWHLAVDTQLPCVQRVFIQ